MLGLNKGRGRERKNLVGRLVGKKGGTGELGKLALGKVPALKEI